MSEWLVYIKAEYEPGESRGAGRTTLVAQTTEGGAVTVLKDGSSVTEVVYNLAEFARTLEDSAIKRGATHKPMLANWPASVVLYQSIAHGETVYVGPIHGLALEALYPKPSPHVLLTWRDGKIVTQTQLA